MKNGSRLKRGISKALIGIMISVCAVFSGWGGVTTVQAFSLTLVNVDADAIASKSIVEEGNKIVHITICTNPGYKFNYAKSLSCSYTIEDWFDEVFGDITQQYNDDYTQVDIKFAFYDHNYASLSLYGISTYYAGSEEPVTTPDTESTDKTFTTVSQPAPSETPSEAKHTHEYEWVTVREATEDMDAEEVYRCKSCGDIKYRMQVPNSAYAQFNQNAITSIDRAVQGAEIKLKTNMWVSFRSEVIETLKEKTDVSVTIDYLYQGIWYTVTIPAGADLDALEDSEGYYGFRYLDQVFEGSRIN